MASVAGHPASGGPAVRPWPIVLLLAGCALEPPVDQPLVPVPVEYPQWWHEVESCVGRSGDFNRVEWYVADLATTREEAGVTYGKQVWIDHGFLNHQMVVKHEMYHVLGGDGDHSEPEWRACHLTWDSQIAG